MMKKLFILTLILSMASLASAALQISVNGDWNPVDSEITVVPSETLTLGIWTDAAMPEGSTWALYTDTSWGTLSGGQYVGPTDGGNIYGDIFPDARISLVLPDFTDGVWGFTVVFAGSGIPADTLLFDDILFHCEWNPPGGDSTIYLALIDDETGQIEEIMDYVVIHPPAEPTTIFLLGLGIVAIRQRKTR